MTGLSDSFQRPINYLRISVTDRCNLRCIYCMPADGVDLRSHSDILSYEEIYTIARAAAELGINKIRITGGEPLIRLGLPQLIRMLASIEAIEDIALTTNGVLLADYAGELKQAGLKRVNISLDTLNPDRFKRITRGESELKQVFEGIEVASRVGLEPVKLNMVVMSGINDDELLDFAAKTIDEEWHVRFIELMPVAGNGDNAPRFISATEMRKRLEPLGELEPCLPGVGNGPAKYFRLAKAKGTIGFITPVSEHFCFNCNRMRLTADGKLRPCLLSEYEIDLKQPLRDGVSKAGLKKLFKQAVAEKPLQHGLAEGQVPNGRPFSHVGG
ncbi:MAG: GTP 3',8-cyclase MoaA [Deltaproteobacteria bacterium]|nr:GTP 3',8-cyclase MoaA [Deltaproteobacteria bacterium]